MNDAEQRLVEDRANRAAARALVEDGVAQVKGDLAARGVGGRIKDKVVGEAEDALAAGVQVARENKPVIAGTIGLLLVWFLRAPLGRLFSGMLGNRPEEIEDEAEAASSDKE